MKQLTVFSFGGGVQSVTIIHLIRNGRLPQPDLVVFADAGWEPAYVHEQVADCQTICLQLGIEFRTVRKDAIGIRSEYGAARMPLFTETGMTRRSCTDRYKIAPINKAVREFLGVPKGARVKDHHVTWWFGITTDEAHRQRMSDSKWKTNSYPLIDLNMSRLDCLKYLESIGEPLPQKSSCVGCPFHGDAYWRWLRDNHRAEFENACDFDDWMREHGIRGMTGTPYLHKDARPLREVNLDYDRTPDMFGNECMGLCDT